MESFDFRVPNICVYYNILYYLLFIALSCIVGLKKWDSGEIEVFGERPGTKESGIPGKRLGYVPQVCY